MRQIAVDLELGGGTVCVVAGASQGHVDEATGRRAYQYLVAVT